MISSDELLFMNLATIKDATHDFSDSNKLGQGGFGAVYKNVVILVSILYGVLPDGNEVAVKRLSRKSWQGIEELKNEVILNNLIAKFQHKNLVRLLGCGLKGDEKLLIYEFMSNKSLDQFIFGQRKGGSLFLRSFSTPTTRIESISENESLPHYSIIFSIKESPMDCLAPSI
ncbi:hypothetical protein AHAS_Ahas10G0115900 [Arachis hypogaea]